MIFIWRMSKIVFNYWSSHLQNKSLFAHFDSLDWLHKCYFMSTKITDNFAEERHRNGFSLRWWFKILPTSEHFRFAPDRKSGVDELLNSYDWENPFAQGFWPASQAPRGALIKTHASNPRYSDAKKTNVGWMIRFVVFATLSLLPAFAACLL